MRSTVSLCAAKVNFSAESRAGLVVASLLTLDVIIPLRIYRIKPLAPLANTFPGGSIFLCGFLGGYSCCAA